MRGKWAQLRITPSGTAHEPKAPRRVTRPPARKSGAERQGSAQEGVWKRYLDAGIKAYKQGRYAEAEMSFHAALKEAERFGPEDSHLATSLNHLGEVYDAQGRYAEAERLHKRALAIREKALVGPSHPDVAETLN